MVLCRGSPGPTESPSSLLVLVLSACGIVALAASALVVVAVDRHWQSSLLIECQLFMQEA